MKSNRSVIESNFRKLEDILKNYKSLVDGKLAGEIPFFIFPHNPKDTNFIEKEASNIALKLKNNGLEIIVIDLFEFSINILEKRKILQSIINKEPSTDKEIFLKQLRPPIDVNNVLAPEINKFIEGRNFDAIFIKGVGSIFPIIRSHNLLNNLQTSINNKPLIMFFPGVYDNISLELFGLLKDDNYYRAFDLTNFEF